MSYLKKIVVIVALLLACGMGFFSYQIYTNFLTPNTAFPQGKAEIFIRTGSTFPEVLQQISPLLKNPESFSKIAQQKGYAQAVKAGHYVLKNGMTNRQILSVLRFGNTPVKVTFNNQERLENLAGRIAQQIEPDSLSLLQAFRDTHFLQENGFTQENALCMYLPNTYEFYWNTSPKQFRLRMAKAYEKFWNAERLQKAENENLTPVQVSVLASIVQKESSKPDEYQRIAGVYLNRLHDGWKLGADPTVIFAIKKGTNNYDLVIKRVLFKDTEYPSPYNTYQVFGLPPGPITMPDARSIDAVLNAEKHRFYFFVADVNRPGYHLFSQTLSQHNQYKKSYVNWLEKNKIKR